MHFDPRDPAFRLDPYPTYAYLRQYAPIYFWPEWSIWFVSSHADCNALLRDPRLGRRYGSGGEQNFPESQQALNSMMSRWMLLIDPPDHTRLRGLVHKAFTPQLIEGLRGQIQSVTTRLLDRAATATTMED